MAIKNGVWIMRGLGWDNLSCTQSWEGLIGLTDEVGFLPLFKNKVDSFSAKKNTPDFYWWAGDEEQDPWRWRRPTARSGRAAYGKLFGGKADLIPRVWPPHFTSWRRDGYDLDNHWDEELATIRQKRIMDQFLVKDEWFPSELRQQAGSGKDEEKNFEGTATDLQMGSCLLIRDFRWRVNKRSFPYSWHTSIYSIPEALRSYDHALSAYSVAPVESKGLIDEQIWRDFPEAAQGELDAVLG